MGVQIQGRVKCDVCDQPPISCWFEQTGPSYFKPIDLPFQWKAETRSQYRAMLDQEERDWPAWRAEAERLKKLIGAGDRSILGGDNILAGVSGNLEWSNASTAGYVETCDRLITCSDDCRKAYETQLRLSARKPVSPVSAVPVEGRDTIAVPRDA